MDDIKMDLQGIEWNCVYCNQVADDMDKGWTVMYMVMNNLVGYSARNCWPAEDVLASQAGLRYVALASERSTCVYCWTVIGWNLVLPLTLKKAKHVAYFVCVSVLFNMHSCLYVVCSGLFTTNCAALSHVWWLLSLSLCAPLRHFGGGWNYSSTQSHLKININFLHSRVLFWYLASNYKLKKKNPGILTCA